MLPASALRQIELLKIPEGQSILSIKYKDHPPILCSFLKDTTSEEGFCLLPNWMMEKLKSTEGDVLNVRTISSTQFPVGISVSLNPTSLEFNKLYDPLVAYPYKILLLVIIVT